LDRELEARGHKFCRYADDCNIYMKSEAAGRRVLASVTEFLEKRLKLKVNREKSAVGKVSDRKFLGHRLLEDGTLGVAPQSRERLKDSLKELTCRNGGKSFENVVQSVNQKLTGWIQYFRMARMKRSGRDRAMAEATPALFETQAVQENQSYRPFPDGTGRARRFRMDAGLVGQRVVAFSRHPTSPPRHEPEVVQANRLDRS